jgi:hypothetical protein
MLGAIRFMTKYWKNNYDNQAISPLVPFLDVMYGLPVHLEEKNRGPYQLTFGMLCKFDLGF